MTIGETKSLQVATPRTIVLPEIFSKQDSNGKFLFANRLQEVKLIRRPNRFIVEVELADGTIEEAHCPTTGGIGGWELSGLQCLISGPYIGNRRTKYTLEALVIPLANGKTMNLGVNQSNANRYIEASLLSGQLYKAVGAITELKRERKLGNARIDFNADDQEFIEVKTPLQFVDLDSLVPQKTTGYASSELPSSTERLVKHVTELTKALKSGQKAILLTCFIYDAPTFNPPRLDAYSKTFKAIKKATNAGLESWQVNFSIDTEGVEFSSLQKLKF